MSSFNMPKIREVIREMNIDGDDVDLTPILQYFPCLKLREGYTLRTYRDGSDDWGYNHDLYCRRVDADKTFAPLLEDDNKSGISVFDFKNYPPYTDDMKITEMVNLSPKRRLPFFLQYFDIEFSADGAIQAWFLLHLTDYMSRFWHCCRGSKNMILEKDDITQLINDHHEADIMTKAKEKLIGKLDVMERLRNFEDCRVMPEAFAFTDFISIEWLYWNDWKGLVFVSTDMVQDGASLRVGNSEEQVLVPYDCGIIF